VTLAGSMIHGPVKTRNAMSKASQLAKDHAMATEGARLAGKNAKDLANTHQTIKTVEARPF
jgi:hypothetical protein